jgi:predicted nucleotidyltransferase component of viral defense system
MGLEELRDFFLVGGTALALQLNHRVSVDLDLFTRSEFNCDEILQSLSGNFQFNIIKKQEKNLMMLYLSDPGSSESTVKVDFLRYPHPLIDHQIQYEGIRLISVKDIIPMKLSAISGRGAKKDFYDIYHLLNEFTLAQMMDFFSQKYPNTSPFQVLKSLLYFADADNDLDPISLKKVSWEDVKNKVRKEVQDYLSQAG